MPARMTSVPAATMPGHREHNAVRMNAKGDVIKQKDSAKGKCS